jgi:hypothetical protein
MRVERLDARAARGALEAHRGAIERCLNDARRRDPTPLTRLRFFDATIAVARDGTASSVEFSPPLYARGLSACMAESFFGWRQAPSRAAGVVHVRVVVATAGRRR